MNSSPPPCCCKIHAPVAGRRSSRGFTLLELLIAMTLVALVALVLAASLHTAFDAKDRSERNIETVRSAELVMEFLRNDLQCALPPRGVMAGTFEGTDAQDTRGDDADDLVFYSTAASPLHPEGANGEIKQIELTSYQPANSTDYVLVRRAMNNLVPSVSVQENPDEEVLCRHCDGFNLRYFDGTDWQDNWDSTQQNNSLPLAVEVTLSIETKDKNPDGSPVVATYVRIFQFPCTGQGNDNVSASSIGSSLTGGQ